MRFTLLLMTVSLASCISFSRNEPLPEDQFGHRLEGTTDDGRTTIAINPPAADVEYRYFPAPYESISVRPGPSGSMGDASSDAGVQVEILVKGAFPDACSELHDVSQQRNGRFLDITLQMRRPVGSVCAAVLRPYRFYLTLEGRYPPGAYTLTLNGRTTPFEITGG
jgi:hypothetical protein